MQDFTYKDTTDGQYIADYSGSSHDVIIENDSFPITGIAAKTFLSNKSLTSIVLPDTVRYLGDWAFAHMKNLEKITLPGHALSLGKDVFMDCPKLSQIYLHNDKSGNPGTPYLLACALTKLKSLSLFSPDLIVNQDTHLSWLSSYDEALIQYIKKTDDEGFEPVFYGWFNDEDADTTQRPAYILANQECKIELALIRLFYSMGLSEENRLFLSDYLISFLPKDKKEYNRHLIDHCTLFRLFYHQYIDDMHFVKLLCECGCFHQDNIPLILPLIENRNAEANAVLLSYCQPVTNTDAFVDFSL